ncbi:MAG: YgfZ/GcvT domain-containing protein [Pseudomonadota bacterium]
MSDERTIPWQSLLAPLEIEVTDGRIRAPEDADWPRNAMRAADEGDDRTAPLDGFGIIQVEGDDATDFLQNQLTNDVRAVGPEQAQLQAWLSPKGRALTTFWLLAHGDGYWLVMPRERIPATLKRLTMFVLRSRVTLTDRSEELAILATAGPGAAGRITDWLGHAPRTPWASVGEDERAALALPDPAGFVAIAPVAEAAAAWSALSAEAAPVLEHHWYLGPVRAGLPIVTEATSEAFVPQMLNWERIGGVSFKKGCYPGQEVVARMHYLGKPKRRTGHYRVEGACPAPGTDLRRNDKEASAGQVVNSAPLPDGGSEVLAVVMTDILEGVASVTTPEGHALIPLELPYTLDDAED